MTTKYKIKGIYEGKCNKISEGKNKLVKDRRKGMIYEAVWTILLHPQ
jgi:hypothetical protein